MHFLRLVLRNTLRHKLRTALTVLGFVVAFLSFGLLQTIVDAWYAGAEGAAPDRLITRNAVSLVVPLPIHYRDKIRGVEGVKSVADPYEQGGGLLFALATTKDCRAEVSRAVVEAKLDLLKLDYARSELENTFIRLVGGADASN